MGGIFSKKEKSRITEQDRAILGLKKQRDQLKQYQRRIEGVLEKDRELARKLLKEGKKDRAKLLLRKKKYQEGLLDQTAGQLDNIERLCQDLEFTQVQKQVLDGLQKGNDALEKANAVFSLDEIESIMSDTEDAVEKQREIERMLSGGLTEVDEEDVLGELASILSELEGEGVSSLPSVPTSKEEEQEGELELPQVPDHQPQVGYGLGHILNDLCASMWFTYLLLFFHQILYFENTYAGVILLVGQVADGLSTAIVGSLCDGDSQEGAWLCRKYGRRKSWHLVGTICVLTSFPFLFMECLGCAQSDEWAQLIYYCAFAVVFQFGWASVQISHLALIPCLTSSQNERTGLTAIRYGMTVMSTITVYCIAWIVLGQSSEQSVGPQDMNKFRTIMFVVLAIGAVASIAFHLTVTEKESSVSGYEEIQGDADLVRPMGMKDWFKEPQFYQVAGIYMCTRLFVNLSQAYIPLYLQESLELESKYVAIIPLVMYCSGFVTSFGMKVLNRVAGRKVSYIAGSVVGLGAAIWVYWGDTLTYQWFKYTGIYFAAVMFGAAGCAVLVTSLSITAELIGPNTESAAFVYGAMSFTDKVSNGLAVMVIQDLIPCIKCCPLCKWYFRDVLFYATGSAALLGALFLMTFGKMKVGARRRDRIDNEDERRRLLAEGEGPVYS